MSHGEFLRKNVKPGAEDPELVKQVKRSFADAELTDREKAMLQYVTKLTLEPSCMSESDVMQLRDAGFDEVQILEVVQLASWFNYMTRVADALGVEVESWRQGWTRELWEEKADEVRVETEGKKRG